MAENVASRPSVKVATPPCAAKAAIPCVLAVRKQHEMLFAASKFEGEKNEFYGTNKSGFGSVKGMEMDKYLELKEKFEANRDDENAVKMAAYMRNLFSFYGLPTPKRKAIYKDFLKSEKRKKIIDWICLTDVMQMNIENFIIL